MSEFIDSLRESRLKAYEADRGDIKEHFGIEEVVLAGGYGYRQVLELVQNGADAILEAHTAGMEQGALARIEVLLTNSSLYVANTGAAFSNEGIDALLRSHSSPKRSNQIGRFGLGFKSLLRLGGKVDIVSGPVAFGFDPDRCRQELRRGFGVHDAPGLRLAWVLDDVQAAALRERFSWATTVVRAEIYTEGVVEHLRAEIQKFPAEFLLFLPVQVTLTLDDGAGGKRELHRKSDGADRLLLEGKNTSRWQIVEKAISITDQRARADATHIHMRDSVPLSWAVPLDAKREEAGRFWAFFPTQTETRLPGILNAPWKLNSDRNAIIGGEWNTVLMREAADLIAATLPKLAASEDPGRPLDAFPRQLDRMDENAAPLVEALWIALENSDVVPDATGTLRRACCLLRHPRDKAAIARGWQVLANKHVLGKFVHPSCLEGQRGKRLAYLAARIATRTAGIAGSPNLGTASVASWFADVASVELSKAVQVLKLAETYSNDCTKMEWDKDRTLLAIIPSDNGQLLTANQVVLAPEGTRVPDGRHPVAQALCGDAEAKRILQEVMRVKPLDDSLWEAMLREALPYWSSTFDQQWCSLWAILRAAPQNVRQQFVAKNISEIRVRRRDGTWVVPDALLLPGVLVSPSDAANQNVLIDSKTHGEDIATLLALGVCEVPEGVTGPSSYFRAVGRSEKLSEWLAECRCRYGHVLEPYQKPQSDKLCPFSLVLPRGWTLLAELVGIPLAKLTKRLLECLGQSVFCNPLKFGHVTRQEMYPTMDVPHPLPWILLKHGTVQVGDETIRLSALLIRRREPALAMIPNWEQLQPAFEKLDGVFPPITATQDEIRVLWLALIKTLAIPPALGDDSLRELWAGAAKDGIAPISLRSGAAEIPLAQIFVTGSQDLARRARTPDRIVVTLDEHSFKLWIEKGARNLSELMSPEWTEQAGPADLLVSTVPDLAEVLRDEIKDVARCQLVTGLKLVLAGHADPVPCLMWDKSLLLDLPQLASLSRADRLQHLLAEVAAAEWLQHEPGEALRILGDAKVDELRAKIAQGSTLAERLLMAAGNRAEPLRQALGQLAGMDFIQRCAPLQLAELTLAQLGPATLSNLEDTLKAEGLKPPSRWSTAEARAFVASLGFPDEFAASSEARRESEEFISGPIKVPSLHDFQEEVLTGLRELVASGTTRRRAVVSLPTGGGKTRVTVEASVLLVLKPEGDCRSIVWVAQTDELCEQAVQAFRQVWLNLGAQRTDLRIVRLWGGNPNPAIQDPDKPVVVVASIQTLNNRMGTDGLLWLQKPGLVVVDECHHAITPSYTNLLRWLDAETPRPGAQVQDEPPIIGLSATPFRTDDEESQRLAKRFDNHWFPADQKQLHTRLRSQGVLAQVEYEGLQSGVSLREDEIHQLSELWARREGIDFDQLLEAINQRLGGDKQRNERLVERIQRAEEHSILFFSNSVLHAEEMSARLNLTGIPAAAISVNTPTMARRSFIDRFKYGEIRVLCNHSILTTGFDAPKTDMVFIARQVFSPVRYMQMVGRGMRGKQFGGTEHCRLVTVLDNLGRFQDKHPYHFCAKYFAEIDTNQT